MSCASNVASVSELSILDLPFGFRNILCLSLRKCFRATFVFCSQKTAIYLHLCDKSPLSHNNKINFVFRVSFAVLQNSFNYWFTKSTSAVPCGLMSEKKRRLYI